MREPAAQVGFGLSSWAFTPMIDGDAVRTRGDRVVGSDPLGKYVVSVGRRAVDIEQTLSVIAVLADGFDPATRAKLPSDHVCQQPDVIRALHQARTIVERQARLERSRLRARVTLPRNTGRSWSHDEDRALALRFKAGTGVVELAEVHGRTMGGIRSRLEKLGLVASEMAPKTTAEPRTAAAPHNERPAQPQARPMVQGFR